MTRQMPHSIDTERALLGTLLVYEKSTRVAIEEGLSIHDFYLDAHRKIFTVIEAIHHEGKLVDVMTVSTKLNDLDQLKLVGGMDYILQLSDSSVTSASTKHYVEVLQDKTYLRRLIETAEEISQDSFDGTYKLEELLDSAEKKILNVTRSRKTADFRSSEHVINSLLDNIYKMRNQKSRITGVKTGYTALDNLTSGLQRGDLIILAARPSMGKTALALNIGLNVAHYNTDEAVAIFSLEMPAEQLMSRMVAKKSQIAGNVLKNGQLSNEEMARLMEASTEMQGMKIFTDDSATIRMSEIFSKCRKLKVEQGLCLIVIDYIQLISSSGKGGENRQQEVSEISRNLKALAREMEVPVVALSQLSRSVETRSEKIPMLSDLRESGSIEQDADIVMFLYRDDYYKKDENKEEPDEQEVQLIIAKHRNGATSSLDLHFKKSISGFYDVSGGNYDG